MGAMGGLRGGSSTPRARASRAPVGMTAAREKMTAASVGMKWQEMTKKIAPCKKNMVRLWLNCEKYFV
jgi:hypothetical protein